MADEWDALFTRLGIDLQPWQRRVIRALYDPPMVDHARRFELHRDVDVSGVSGTGVVAEGVIFRDGVGVLRWLTEWPTSVVHYDRGLEAIEHVHGHGGSTRIVFLDE